MPSTLRAVGAILLCLVVVACTTPLVGELRESQESGEHGSIVAQRAEVTRLCAAAAGEECAQARAILGHACYAQARQSADTSAVVEHLDCAVQNLGAALAHVLPETVGGRSLATYRVTYMEALSDRLDRTASFAEGAPYTRRIADTAAAFKRDYPGDWRGYYFAGQAALQEYNATLGTRPDAACDDLGRAESELAAADALSEDPRIDQALTAVDLGAAACGGGG